MSSGARPPLIVAVLCAAWCRTCSEFAPVIHGIAASRPDVRFVSIDIEDEAALCNDLDIDDFPTLAVMRGGVPLHFGASLPQPGVVARLVDALEVREADPEAPWTAEIRAFVEALTARASG